MDNKLQLIVNESGLEMTKAQYILDKFTGYFEIAAEWEKKAGDIVVVDETNKVEMQMARVGRLFLRDKRIGIEKARVELKEQALREGKAIDGIANVLKALIVPIEEYLDKQERFTELKELRLAEEKRIEDEKKAEEERLAKEEADRKEQERIRLENIKLKEEVEAREKKMAEERAKAEAERIMAEEAARKAKEESDRLAEIAREKAERVLAEQRAKAEADRLLVEELAKKAKEEADRLARVAKEKADKELADERARAEVERVRIEELAKVEKEKAEKKLAQEKEKLEAEKLEKIRIQKLLDEQIECPFCHKKFNK